MRKLIALITMALSTAVNAQTVTPIAGDYNYTGNVYFTKGMFIPVRDTIAGYVYRVGAQSIRPADTVGHPLTVPVYVWTGRRWFNIAGGGGNTYTAGNGLSLTGSQFRLGGALDANTSVTTGSFGFNINASQPGHNTLYLGPGTGGTSRIGYNNPDGSYGGYEYLPDYGRGQSNFYTKGFAVATLDYAGLRIADSTGTNKISLNTDGTFVLKQDNGNPYLEAASNKLLLSAESDTTFYTDNTRVQFRALANTDPLKVLSADQFGALQLVTSPSANTIYSSNGSISGERTITGNADNGVNWNSFNAFQLNLDDGAGSNGFYGFYPYGFQYTWNPAGQPSSSINYNSSAYSVSLTTGEGYNISVQENAQIGLGYSIYEKATGGITQNEKIEIQQGFQADSNLYSIRHYKTNRPGDPGILFGIDTFGSVKMQRYKNNTGEDSVLSTDQFGRVKMKSIGNSPNIYNSDGTLSGNRTLYLDGHDLLFNNTSGSYGVSRFLMSNGSVQITNGPEAGDPNTNYPSVLNIGNYNTKIGSEGIRQFTYAEFDSIQARLKYSYNYGSQSGWFDNVLGTDSNGLIYTHNHYVDYTPIPKVVIRVDSNGVISDIRYKNNSDGDSVLSTDVNGNVKLKSLDESFIKNRISPAQTSTNFNIDGIARSGQVRAANLLITDNSAILGGISCKIQTVTGNTTLDYTNYAVEVNNSGAATITLPAAVDNPGAIYFIKKISAASNNVILDGGGSDTVDGSANKTLTLQNSCIMVMSDGVTNWVILASHAAATTL